MKDFLPSGIVVSLHYDKYTRNMGKISADEASPSQTIGLEFLKTIEHDG